MLRRKTVFLIYHLPRNSMYEIFIVMLFMSALDEPDNLQHKLPRQTVFHLLQDHSRGYETKERNQHTFLETRSPHIFP